MFSVWANVLGSGEFQARAADLLPGLQVGPDAVAAVVRVVQGQGVSVGKGPHHRLVGSVHHGEPGQRTRHRRNRRRRLTGQRFLILGVVGEGHLHLDGLANVGGRQGVAFAGRARDVHVVSEPLVAVGHVAQSVGVPDVRRVRLQRLPHLGRSADGGRTRGRAVLHRFVLRCGRWSWFWCRSWVRRRFGRRWRGSRRGVGPGQLGPLAFAVPVHRHDPVNVAFLRLSGAVGVVGGVRAGVGLDGHELAEVVNVPVPPQHLVVGDAVVAGVVPGEVNRVMERLGGQARGLGRCGAVLGLGRRAPVRERDSSPAPRASIARATSRIESLGLIVRGIVVPPLSVQVVRPAGIPMAVGAARVESLGSRPGAQCCCRGPCKSVDVSWPLRLKGPSSIHRLGSSLPLLPASRRVG